MTRAQIEAAALRAGVKLDGIADDVVAARVVLARVAGVDANGSRAYVEHAIEALVGDRSAGSSARADGARRAVRLDAGEQGSAAAARAAMLAAHEAAWRAPLAARVDDARAAPAEVARVDASAPLEQLLAASEASRAKFREDSELAWQKPLERVVEA
jgi:hypothetical protein